MIGHVGQSRNAETNRKWSITDNQLLMLSSVETLRIKYTLVSKWDIWLLDEISECIELWRVYLTIECATIQCYMLFAIKVI